MDEKINDINNNIENNVQGIPNNIEPGVVSQNEIPTQQTINNNVERPNETQEMIDMNKRVISASPQMVDSSSINISQETTNTNSESNIVSETVIDTDLNNLVFEEEQKEGAFEEVSLTLDNSALDLNESEINPNSIFNKTESVNETNQEPVKMGEEKHNFPFFMVFVFLIVIVLAFNIETVTEYINKFLNKNVGVQEEPKEEPKKKEILLKDIQIKLNDSEVINEFKNDKKVEVSINLDEANNKLSFTTTNYIKLNNSETLTVIFEKEDTDLVATCTDESIEFCEVVTTATVLSIAKIEGTYNKELENYLKENIVFGAININGFTENPISEGRIFRISLINNISLPETK